MKQEEPAQNLDTQAAPTADEYQTDKLVDLPLQKLTDADAAEEIKGGNTATSNTWGKLITLGSSSVEPEESKGRFKPGKELGL